MAQEAPPLVVLVTTSTDCVWLRSLAERRFAGLPRVVEVTPIDVDAQTAVQDLRRSKGGVPLGVIVTDEAEGLAVLELGADDALPEANLEDQAVVAFFDRVLLRARLRREQERLQASFAHSEKLAALGTLVAGVAHEINNPLTSLLLSVEGLKVRTAPLHRAYQAVLELARSGHAPSIADLETVLKLGRTGAPLAETEELLEETASAANTIARVVRDLKLFSRPDDEVAPEVIDLRDLVEQVLRIVGRQLREHAVIERDYEAELPLVVAPSARLVQVITNILLNAAQAVNQVARPAHRIRISARADDETVALAISDTGPGISSEVVERIFDPFFTTKREGMGTGLGLSISRSILRRLGGDLLVESVHGDGATFVALIPRPDRSMLFAAYRRATPPVPADDAGRQQRVLVLDTDERVLRAFARALDAQYEMMLAQDEQEAIDLLESGSQADVVVADVSAPDRPGLGLYRWLLQHRPALAKRVIFVAAGDQERPVPVAETDLIVLEKPVARNELLNALDGALHRPIDECVAGKLQSGS